MVPVRLVRRFPARVGSEALARIVASLREQVDAIRGHAAGARRGTDPEDVHEMRTAARRLRAILRAVRSGFARAWVEALRSELDWLGSTLGAVRDLDVLREHLRDELAALEDSTRRRSASLQLSECLDVEHQDAVMAESRIRAWLRGIRSRPATWLREHLIKRQRARRQEARKAFWKRWPRLKRRGRKAWT